MKLSKRGEYALRALIDLGIAAELGRPLLQVSELAAKEKLPIKILDRYTLADIVEITLRKMRRDKVSPPFISRAFNLDSVLTSLPVSSANSPKRSSERRTHAA